jgi:3-methyladenine DNA glycosylase AlkC
LGSKQIINHGQAQPRDVPHLSGREAVHDGPRLRHEQPFDDAFKVEICSDFAYFSGMVDSVASDSRKGARRLADVPPSVLLELSSGRCETRNLMEWLAADMPRLCLTLAQTVDAVSAEAWAGVAVEMRGLGVLGRLKIAGRTIARLTGAEGISYEVYSQHCSDIVRQWACYAVNDAGLALTLAEKLDRTRPYAADQNMSVREAAWMAFRPHVSSALHQAIQLLEPLSRDSDARVRRFAIEVTRPRSVWGAHIPELRREPKLAAALLNNVRADPARYVQLAAGNWLNDASKTRPDWVEQTCDAWSKQNDPFTQFIVRRGRRSLIRTNVKAMSLPFFEPPQAA